MNPKDLSFKKQLAACFGQMHLDSSSAAFLEKELTKLRAKTFEHVYPDLIATQLMPLATDISEWQTTYEYKVLKATGKAKRIAFGDVTDVPRVDAEASPRTGVVRKIGASYALDVDELKTAAALGMPLSETKAKMARDAIERGVDSMLAIGKTEDDGEPADTNIVGLANNADVEGLGIGSLTYWVDGGDDATIIAELAGLITAPSNASKDKFKADTLLLPTAKFNYISQKPFSSSYDGTSLLETFKKNNPGVLVRPWWRLDTAGANGAPRAIAYQRDPSVLEGVLTQQFEQMAPEVRGFALLILCSAKCGGVKVYQPAGVKYGDFATS